ncbi:MAG: DHA2 family efflux MFS transporter permease subunit [Cyanobacteria bacterium]|nr:DHA2 family efflux MFS transporter permease subunit [Cyanobacteria bacterium GSL.Bin1]
MELPNFVRTATARTEVRYWTRAKAATLMAMCLALLMINIDDTLLNVALPQIQSGLNINLSRLQWILTANALPSTSFVLSAGRLGDIYGHKRIFLGGLFAYALGSLVCGFAPGLGVLVGGRVLQGLGDAALVQASLSILTDTFPEEKQKAKAIGMWTAVAGLALITGPVLGGLLVDQFGWQSVFFINLPLAILTFGVTSWVVKEVRNPNQQSIDLPGLLLSIIFLGSFVYAITEGYSAGWQSPLIIGLFAMATLSLLAFLVIESHRRSPMLPLNLFRHSNFTIANIVSVLVFLTLVSLLFLFNLFLQQIKGYSALGAGVRFLPLNGAFIVASFVSGWLVARLGWRFAISNGLILMSIATFSFLSTSANTEYQDIWLSCVVYGFGAGLTLSPLSSLAMSAIPFTQVGIASAIHGTFNRMGWILGIALQGTILSQGLTANLQRSLSDWNLPSNLQNQIIADALHNGTQIPSDLPERISPSLWHQLFSQAFVSGLHTAILIASMALVIGVLLILAFVPSSVKGMRDRAKE